MPKTKASQLIVCLLSTALCLTLPAPLGALAAPLPPSSTFQLTPQEKNRSISQEMPESSTLPQIQIPQVSQVVDALDTQTSLVVMIALGGAALVTWVYFLLFPPKAPPKDSAKNPSPEPEGGSMEDNALRQLNLRLLNF